MTHSKKYSAETIILEWSANSGWIVLENTLSQLQSNNYSEACNSLDISLSIQDRD